ncbi:MAG: transglycosylase domain-containing protein [Allosphingosinicella sp.]|uniref:transglycosylase domain-containing protein n=1 Tax=Allosphingosinicella sp. TaxID=2823234 RepID=UPI00393584EB
MASQAPSRVGKTLIALIKIGLYLFVLALVALVVAVSVAVSQLPSYQELVRRDDLGQMIRVRAADGSVIHSMGPSFGEWLSHDEIPAIMRDAMIAVEDRRFHYHPGVDPIGIARGIWVGWTRDDRVRGVSTIAQQLARNIFLTNDRSMGRKIREGILALALERRFSKEQVLELYLNRVYFGGGAYGIDAASRRFFGHSATELNAGQAAIIAGLVKAPSNYSPTADAEAARARANIVLQLMVREGAISEAQARAANPQQVEFVRTAERHNSARYFTDWVLPQLETLIDETVQPIDVWTTLDVGLQRAADEALNANAPSAQAQGALVSLDRDGAVRALVGGRDYVDSIYNRATQATRQPGSAFKLFVYLAALETGYTPTSTVVDEPVTINGWSPRNDNGRYQGPVSLRAALALSINTVAVRIAQDVGTRTVADMAQRFGITTRVDTNPSMALGTSEVRLIDLTRAYASVAQRGVAVVPYGIRRVTTADGTLLYQHRSDESRVLVAPWVAAQMTDLLQAAVMTGTGRAAQLGRPTAGKTGTTSSNKDGWFVGFSSGLTTGVWYGRDDNRALPGLAGGRAPARAFHQYMARAVANRPVENFEIEVALPDWQVEPDAESWYGAPDDYQLVDPDGNPIQPVEDGPPPPPQPREPGSATTEELNQEWLDHAIGRNRAPQAVPQERRGPPPDRGPPPRRQQQEVMPPLPGQRQSAPPVVRPTETPPPTIRPRAPGTAE